jgi:hydroxymethylpyrimidine pyrophosphatase-like HAD family hydrolase
LYAAAPFGPDLRADLLYPPYRITDMYYQALAADYDGTLAKDGRVDEATLAALHRLKASGRRLILVSGRERADLLRVFPDVSLFDRLVLENGAVLVRPGEDAIALADPPPSELITRLREQQVSPLSCGDVIVSSWEPNETTVLQTIHELGLEHQVIFNKGAVMVLPPGVNKASGLRAALDDLKLSAHNVVGIGDAENDGAFLNNCGCAVAVANALASIKDRADIVTDGSRGEGVIEIADRLLANDLAEVPTAPRHRVLLADDDQLAARWPDRGSAVLIAGTSGSGKSTLVQALLERLTDREYQFCVVDPEGDYGQLAEAFTVGAQDQSPKTAQVMEILEEPAANVAVNLLAIPLAERPDFFTALLSCFLQLRLRSGRPHWIVVDEAHHMVPPSSPRHAPELSQQLEDLVFVTVHADQLSPVALAKVKLVLAVGTAPKETIARFAEQTGRATPRFPTTAPSQQDALVWAVDAAEAVIIPRPEPRGERRRHIRKYAEGQLGEDKSFYFRGPDNRLNLRAHNLSIFVQIAEGVDDATWLHHLRAGDYSRWFREAIKDAELAHEVHTAEVDAAADAALSRDRILSAVGRRYTAPASSA